MASPTPFDLLILLLQSDQSEGSDINVTLWLIVIGLVLALIYAPNLVLGALLVIYQILKWIFNKLYDFVEWIMFKTKKPLVFRGENGFAKEFRKMEEGDRVWLTFGEVIDKEKKKVRKDRSFAFVACGYDEENPGYKMIKPDDKYVKKGKEDENGEVVFNVDPNLIRYLHDEVKGMEKIKHNAQIVLKMSETGDGRDVVSSGLSVSVKKKSFEPNDNSFKLNVRCEEDDGYKSSVLHGLIDFNVDIIDRKKRIKEQERSEAERNAAVRAQMEVEENINNLR